MSASVSRHWSALALTGALLLGACSKQEPPDTSLPPPAPLPSAMPRAPKGTPEAPRASLAEQPSDVEYVMPRAPVTANAAPGPLPRGFMLGQPRADVLRLLGDCAERMHYLPGGSGSLSVEIVQPKAGECRKRLGDRHFTLTGGVLKAMTPGALPPPPAPRPPPQGV